MRLVSPTLPIAVLSCERLAGASAPYHRYDSNPANGRGGLQHGGVRLGGGGGGGDRSDRRPGHSAAMDRNDNGIKLDDDACTYGQDVEGSFELTSDRVRLDVLAELDLARMGEWTVGVFMRMQRPVGENPILSVIPTIERVDEVDRASAEISIGSPPQKAKQVSLDLPDLDLKGTFTIPGRSTTAEVLDENRYGLGFDVYLLDEEGRDILGPATFYMVPMEKTEGMQEAEAAAA